MGWGCKIPNCQWVFLSNSLLNQFPQHGNKPGLMAHGVCSNHLYIQLLTQLPGLRIQVKQDLHVC